MKDGNQHPFYAKCSTGKSDKDQRKVQRAEKPTFNGRKSDGSNSSGTETGRKNRRTESSNTRKDESKSASSRKSIPQSQKKETNNDEAFVFGVTKSKPKKKRKSRPGKKERMAAKEVN